MAVSGRGYFQDFRPGFRFWHICHVDRHGHFTLKLLRLPLVNEVHTNSYTGPRLISEMQLSFQGTAEPDSKYSILSFGCGDGTKDQAILATISSLLSGEERIVYNAVDPAVQQIEKFRNAVKDKECFKKVHFDFFSQTYEDYMKSERESKNLPPNLILFIDSLCHFKSSPEDALVHCYHKVLAQNGVILITQWNNQDFWFKIREIYGKAINSESRKAEEGNDYLTIQEVEKIVKNRGWSFQFFSPEYNLDVTECFNPTSVAGRYLFDCLSCFSNVRDEARTDPKKLLDFLRQSTLICGDKHVLKGKQGVILISKQE